MDGAVLGFTLLVALGAGLLFGMAPVVQVIRRNLPEVFRGTERAGTAERGALVTRTVLVVGQVYFPYQQFKKAYRSFSVAWRTEKTSSPEKIRCMVLPSALIHLGGKC